jgi:hypothetical protein
MSVLEIAATPRPCAPVREKAVPMRLAALGLSAAPNFLEPTQAAAGPGGTLWDMLRLSWTELQTQRDLLGL